MTDNPVTDWKKDPMRENGWAATSGSIGGATSYKQIGVGLTQSYNDVIAVEPFGEAPQLQKSEKGFALNQRASLVGLKVVYANAKHNLLEGQTVYISGEMRAHSWAKNPYKLKADGPEFILIPVSEIKLTSWEK